MNNASEHVEFSQSKKRGCLTATKVSQPNKPRFASAFLSLSIVGVTSILLVAIGMFGFNGSLNGRTLGSRNLGSPTWGSRMMGNQESDELTPADAQDDEEAKLDQGKNRNQLWREVNDAQRGGLPKTAARKLALIYQKALDANDNADAIKALGMRLMAEGSTEDPAAVYMIQSLEEQLQSADPELQPIMKLLLANWYFAYFQQNRWRFSQRDQTAESPGDDIQTWDLPRLLSHVDSLYRDALVSADQLKKIRVEKYQKILTKSEVSVDHRPTLFDFVAFQALQFYQLDEQIIRQQDAFEVSADGLIYASQEEFLQWRPSTDDDDAYLLHAIQILQELGEFHRDDANPTAGLDAELQRYEFALLVAVGSESTARYEAALQRFADQHQDHPLSSLALARLASSQFGRGDYVLAMKTATIAENRSKGSAGSNMAHNLKLSIQQKEIALQAEGTWNASSSDIEVRYRNIDQVHFRLVPFDYFGWEKWGRFNEPQYVSQQEREAFFRRDPVKQWSVSLPNKNDYQPAHYRCDAPLEDVPPGSYMLLASGDDTFAKSDNALALAHIWISNLAVVTQTNRSGDSEGQLLDAISGLPIKDATVQLQQWEHDNKGGHSVDLEKVTTDADGLFPINRVQGNSQRLLVKSGKQSLGFPVPYGYYQNRRDNEVQRRTVFFTDRSIYRPGQTIQFKGVLLKSSFDDASYETVAKQKVTVSLRDINDEIVEQLELVSNDYGSVSGSFTAPNDRATGRMRINVESSAYGGATSVAVEEYKRPKFYTEIEAPAQQFHLQQQAEVSGKATAYTGAAIDGAKVTWRVVREVRYPDWWMWRCWYCPPVYGQSQEIANGETTTDIDGVYKIGFVAEPDQSVDRESQPIFSYSVYADVTDTTGETRSASYSIRLGYTSLQANLQVENANWLTAESEVAFTAKLTNLSGQGQATEGKLTIFRLQQPEQVHKQVLGGMTSLQEQVFAQLARNNVKIDPNSLEENLSDYDRWSTGEEVSSQDIETDASGDATVEVALSAGAYRAKLTSVDAAGNEVLAESSFVVLDPSQKKLDLKLPQLMRVEKASVQPGETFRALWGTGYDEGQAYVQWIHRGQTIESFWTNKGETQAELTFTPEEKHRGGLNLIVTFVRENRVYQSQQFVDVPWKNKELTVKWERFVSKLTPGGKETWTAVISGSKDENVVAEMVATLYDASLDAFSPHYWSQRIGSFYQDYLYVNFWNSSSMKYMNMISSGWHRGDSRSVRLGYSALIPELSLDLWAWRRQTRGFSTGGFSVGGGGGARRFAAPGAEMDFAQEEVSGGLLGAAAPAAAVMAKEKGEADDGAAETPAADIKLDNVTARKNLQETAFFFPNLVSNEKGEVRIEFEVPEALTEWKFMGLAHDSQQRSGYLSAEAVTSKDLMVQPNPPRFMREGDQLEFSVKVSNQSSTVQNGKVRLTFADLQTGASMDEALENLQNEQEFEIPAGQSRSFYWKLKVPDFVGVLTYKAVGGTEKISDGEEGFLPVLSKRLLVTESLPLPIRGNETKEFKFDHLLESADSDSLKSQTLTIQMTSNPSWYAVMALPYLMEYPHQCNEQVFNRLYANALARHIVTSDDRIAGVFQQWRNTDALDSPLEKNEELKNILIQQSPWLLDAKKESQARRNVGVLFDNNRLDAELRRAMQQLSESQLPDGSWSWFPGGRSNDYITLYITTGFGRLRQLKVGVDVEPAIRSLDRLDAWIEREYQRIVERGDLDKNNLSHMVCLYLYGRSFFLEDKAIDPEYKAAFDYFVAQGRLHWVGMGRQSQGHLAIAFNRLKDRETPAKIIASLTERSKNDPEMGMYWLVDDNAWWWYQAPIETQALMIEVYEEVAGDAEKVEDLKVWLLKQKQTQNWKTTKATADAVYALLLRGTNQLASNQLVEVTLAGEKVEPEKVEAGTGFYQQRWVRGEIKPEMGNVTLTKRDQGVAWGSVHWQYLEDISKIPSYDETALKLTKSLYRKVNSPNGPVIEKVDGAVNVGDEIVVRVELRTDRDMEYVHLMDYRGSGTEPVNVMSRYRYQDGLAYYESTKDTASHFFIDYLPRGTYVFEYSVRVQHRGVYESGIAQLQCMYAPEFNSHSQSVTMEVQ